MPAPKVPTAQAAGEKLDRVAPTRQADYDAGISDPSVDWQGATAASDAAWKDGMQDAITRNAYKRGVDATSTDDWRERTKAVGSGRWAPGVRAGKNRYVNAMAPVLDTIARTNIPPRGKRGDPKNQERARLIGEALAMARTKG